MGRGDDKFRHRDFNAELMVGRDYEEGDSTPVVVRDFDPERSYLQVELQGKRCSFAMWEWLQRAREGRSETREVRIIFPRSDNTAPVPGPGHLYEARIEGLELEGRSLGRGVARFKLR